MALSSAPGPYTMIESPMLAHSRRLGSFVVVCVVSSSGSADKAGTSATTRLAPGFTSTLHVSAVTQPDLVACNTDSTERVARRLGTGRLPMLLALMQPGDRVGPDVVLTPHADRVALMAMPANDVPP